MCNQIFLFELREDWSVSEELCIDLCLFLFLIRNFSRKWSLSTETFICVVYLQCLMGFSASLVEWRKRSIAQLLLALHTLEFSLLLSSAISCAVRSISRSILRDARLLRLDSIQKRHINIPAVWNDIRPKLKPVDRPHHTLRQIERDIRLNSAESSELNQSEPIKRSSVFWCFF